MSAPSPAGVLRFDLSHGGASHLAPEEVPVEVRRSNLTLAATVLSAASAELAPGLYYVSARLPGGRILRGQGTVRAGETETVALTPDDEDEDAATGDAWVGRAARSVVRPARAEDMATAGAGATARPDVAVRLLAGNVLAGQCTPVDSQRWSTRKLDAGIEMTIPGENRPYQVQIWQRGQPPVNMAVPTSGGNPCRLLIAKGSDGRYAAWATLANAAADVLVRYAYRGDVRRSTVVSLALNAEALLASKLVDPIAAAVGAYALLKLGDLDRLHEWTETLRREFPWLPDGLVVRGEHLARTGRHEEACDAFVDLPRRGLPISSEGLSWSVDRLRSYARPGTRVPDERRKRAQMVLVALQPFAMAADFRCPFTAYPGADPQRPSAAIPSENPPPDARAFG